MIKLEKIITEIWNDIDSWMNNDIRLISSEKSVVFNFAWELAKKYPKKIKFIDFETNLFNDFSDGKFLDLFIIFNDGTNDIKIGIEFKFPHKKARGSNQTVSRQKIINDIKRINWLVENGKIDLGCFLCITNETGYINPGNFRVAPEFITHQGKIYEQNEILPSNEFFIEEVIALNRIEFNWRYVELVNNKFRIDNDKKFSFLNPIFIKK
ncbi:hypothetical protein [Winogradskyella damuponensis]|uniref:Restriction endonuclease n=1 Tax=Winogradskyella damuponensis TaxID=943939 RepID=A0ABP8D3K1_9FLAO